MTISDRFETAKDLSRKGMFARLYAIAIGKKEITAREFKALFYKFSDVAFKDPRAKLDTLNALEDMKHGSLVDANKMTADTIVFERRKRGTHFNQDDLDLANQIADEILDFLRVTPWNSAEYQNVMRNYQEAAKSKFAPETGEVAWGPWGAYTR